METNQEMKTELSPAAQYVLDVFTEDNCLHDWKHNHYNVGALAAALRAVADQVVEEASPVEAILAIATELLRSAQD